MLRPTNLCFSFLIHCLYMAMILSTVSGMLVYTTSSTVVLWAVILCAFVVSFLSSITCKEGARPTKRKERGKREKWVCKKNVIVNLSCKIWKPRSNAVTMKFTVPGIRRLFVFGGSGVYFFWRFQELGSSFF